MSVQHYTWNKRGLGEKPGKKAVLISTQERTFINEQLLRTDSTSCLFREDGKTGPMTWLNRFNNMAYMNVLTGLKCPITESVKTS